MASPAITKMGRTPNWFRKLFGLGRKKQSDESDTKPGNDRKQNHQLCSSHPYGNAECASSSSYTTGIDASKHAIVVAAATAAVAEAAVAAAKAAAEVVRLTSGTGRSTPRASSFVGGSGWFWKVVAVVKIQSAFRAYLARRALRALKALVKLQALVRGHIVRKQTADTLRCMQSLVRVQSRARASRAHLSESSQLSIRSSLSHHHTSSGPAKYNHQSQNNGSKFDQSLFGNKYGSNSRPNESCQGYAHYGSNWLDRWTKESSEKGYARNDRTDEILEIDTCNSNFQSRQNSRTSRKSNHGVPHGYYDRPSMSFFPQNHIPAMPFADSSSLSSLMYQNEKDEATSWTAENSPHVFSASSRPGSSARTGRSAFSPTKSEFSRSLFKGYAAHPNYMANTESYRAKVRSQSAPRQRIELEKFGSTRKSIHGFSNMMATSQDYEDLRR